jgi:hypothetical protein
MSQGLVRQSKRILGLTIGQLSLLAIPGILLCLLLSTFIGWIYRDNVSLLTAIRTLAIPTDIPATSTQTPNPSLTPTSSQTASPTPTITDTPEPTITPTPTIVTSPDTLENIHVAQIFNGAVDDPQEEVGKVDFVWGSKFPDQPAQVYNSFYYPFDRDLNLIIDGVRHDIQWFLANHPDWLVYTCDKKTPAYEYGDPNVPLDITNLAVRVYMLETYIFPAIQDGYRWIAFDNIDFGNNGGRCGVWKNGEWVRLTNYIQDVLNWAAWMSFHLHTLDISLAMNFPFDFNYPDESYQIYQYLDIALDERGFTNWGRSEPDYLPEDLWLANMQALQSLDELGKGFISINQFRKDFDEISQTEKQWALANYLLVKGKYSYIAITGYQEYGHLFTTPEYYAPIGYALNSMYLAQGVYMRDFSNGKAIVNPSSDQSFAISLPTGVYQDLYNNNLDAVILEPHSGIVLLGKPISASLRQSDTNPFLEWFPGVHSFIADYP